MCTVSIGLPQQTLGWFPIGLGLVVEGKPTELSCMRMYRSSGVTSDSEVGTPRKCRDKYSGITSDSEVASPVKQ